MSQKLLNKVAVVTGASSGIGKSIVENYLAEGAKVVIFSRNQEKLERMAATVLVIHNILQRSLSTLRI
jgi:NADP-dependent 3-hydroxy acid dehydrogenase YdfG